MDENLLTLVGLTHIVVYVICYQLLLFFLSGQQCKHLILGSVIFLFKKKIIYYTSLTFLNHDFVISVII